MVVCCTYVSKGVFTRNVKRKLVVWQMLQQKQIALCCTKCGEDASALIQMGSTWVKNASLSVWLYFVIQNKLCFAFSLNKPLTADIVRTPDLTLRKSAWWNMNTNGERHYYEGYCVSWKAQAISMRATARTVRFVSERVTTLAAALASKKYLCSTSSTWNPKNVSHGRTKRWTMTALSVVRCFLSNG